MADDSTGALTRPAPPPGLTLRYGGDPDQVVDVRLPPSGTGARPVVVVVHGGFWRAAYDRTHTGPQAGALAEAGYVVAVPEYRRTGQPGGGWPGTLDDTAAWSDALPELLAAALGDRVDVSRLVLVGHSAGGHLALWAASRHRLPTGSPWHRATPPPVTGVVSLAGVCDLSLAADLRLGNGAVQDFLGGDPSAVPERYAAADPAVLLPAAGRVALVHGQADPDVPACVSRAYAERARAAGAEVRLVELPETGHFEPVDPRSSAWPTVLEGIASLLA